LLDLILLIPLAWGAYRGFQKGLVRELCALGAFFLAALGSIKLLDQAIVIGTQWGYDFGESVPYVAFVLVFILILVSILLAGRLVRRLIQPTLLGSIDSLVGSVLGLCKWALVVSALLSLSRSLDMAIPEAYTQDSWLLPWLETLVPQGLHWCLRWMPGLEAGRLDMVP